MLDNLHPFKKVSFWGQDWEESPWSESESEHVWPHQLRCTMVYHPQPKYTERLRSKLFLTGWSKDDIPNKLGTETCHNGQSMVSKDCLYIVYNNLPSSTQTWQLNIPHLQMIFPGFPSLSSGRKSSTRQNSPSPQLQSQWHRDLGQVLDLAQALDLTPETSVGFSVDQCSY